MSGKSDNGVFKAPFFRSPYNYDTKAASDAHSVETVGPSLTVQAQAEDADINVLMRRFGVTGRMPENPRLPSYGDFTGIRDFQSALNAVLNAEEAFGELTAEVRARFGNDPQLLLEFCEDAKNVEEARKLGLLKPTEAPLAPMKVEVVSQPAIAVANSVPAPAQPPPAK